VYQDKKPITVSPPGKPLVSIPISPEGPKYELRAVSSTDLYYSVLNDEIPAELLAKYPGFLQQNAVASGSIAETLASTPTLPTAIPNLPNQNTGSIVIDNPVAVQRDIFNSNRSAGSTGSSVVPAMRQLSR
jgi:hypothetical protein